MKKIFFISLIIIFAVEYFACLGHASPGMMGGTYVAPAAPSCPSTTSCNSTTYTNAETCVYFCNVTNAGGTVANLAMYDAYVTTVKALTTSGCDGTFPGCAGIAYDANFGYHTTAANVDTVYDGTNPAGATTATATSGHRPAIQANSINASCTGYHAPYNVTGCVCSSSGAGSCPNVQAWILDGSSKTFSINTLPTFLNSASSIFAVVAGNSSIGLYTPFFQYSNGTAAFPVINLDTYDSTTYSINYDVSGSVSSYVHSSTNANTTRFYMMESNWPATTCTIANTKINGGTTLAPTTTGTQACSSGETIAFIGGNATLGYWYGNIGGIYGFKVQLSSGDMTTIRNYLYTYYTVY